LQAAAATATANLSDALNNSKHNNISRRTDMVIIVMPTLLWTSAYPTSRPTPAKSANLNKNNNEQHNTCVRGHACVLSATPTLTGADTINGMMVRQSPLPPPIHVSLAMEPLNAVAPRHTRGDQPMDIDIYNVIPLSIQRHDNNPEAKLSSWCRDRRPTEETCKPPPPEGDGSGSGISEVLLLRRQSDSYSGCLELECLEGLTSNPFVFYNDGTLRTAPSNSVLNGYIRSRVIDLVNNNKEHVSLGLNLKVNVVEQAPILQDMMDGQWVCASMASSISLIRPIQRIVVPVLQSSEKNVIGNANADTVSHVPNKNKTPTTLMEFETLWEAPSLCQYEDGSGSGSAQNDINNISKRARTRAMAS
jgi:hypothetical protein